MIRGTTQRSTKFTIFGLLLITFAFALIFASWRLASHYAGALMYVVFFQLGSAAGFALLNRSQVKRSVLRAAFGGCIGGSFALLASVLLFSGAWRVFASWYSLSNEPWMAVYFLFFWGIVGGICGGGCGIAINFLFVVYSWSIPVK